MMEAKTITHTFPGNIGIEPVQLPALQEGQVRIRALYTGIRHADEYHFLQYNDQPGKALPETWGCGFVEDAGSGTSGWNVGDMVVAPMRHQTRQIVDGWRIYPIRNMRPEFSIFTAASITALHAMHCSSIRYGDRIAVTGMGTVGLMTVQYALVSGATHIAAFDLLEDRLKTAQRLGAHDISTPQAYNANENGYRIVFECSGKDEGLLFASELLAKQGQLVLGGCRYTQDAAQKARKVCAKKESMLEHCSAPPINNLEERVVRSLQTKHVLAWPIPFETIPFEEAPKAYEKLKQPPHECVQLGLSYVKGSDSCKVKSDEFFKRNNN